VRTNYIVVTNLPPQLVVTPSSRNFGELIIGQTNTQPFSVINAGGLTLTGSVAVSSPFCREQRESVQRRARQTGTVNVSFIPVTAGTFSNNLIFTSNGGNSTNLVTASASRPPGWLSHRKL